MKRTKEILKGSTHICARYFVKATAPIRMLHARFSDTRAVSAARSFVRKLDIRAAHRVGMPVEEFDANRRVFLKYALFGSAIFVASKYIAPLVNALRGDTVLSERTFENFKITETGRRLLVTDDDGSEILTIDKESF